LSFSEHNDLGIKSEPDDCPGSVIPADAVDGLDEVAKCQSLILVIIFHNMFVLGSALIQIVDLPHSSIRPLTAWFIPHEQYGE
jgi:hypothetical protein